MGTKVLEVAADGTVELDSELFQQLLRSARNSQKGRRGLSRKKLG